MDWGGVLTAPLDRAMRAWAERDGVDFAHFRDVMADWVGRRRQSDVGPVVGGHDPRPRAGESPAPAAPGERQDGELDVAAAEAAHGAQAHRSPVHELERGELAPREFEVLLAEELGRRGSPVDPAGLLDRLLGDLVELSDPVLRAITTARRAGVRTALLSNSWGDHYPDALFANVFDAVVISGRVGMRKPEPEIFWYTADALGLPPADCVMVDDLPHNVRGAVAVGMIGVLHEEPSRTVQELQVLLELDLGADDARSPR